MNIWKSTAGNQELFNVHLEIYRWKSDLVSARTHARTHARTYTHLDNGEVSTSRPLAVQLALVHLQTLPAAEGLLGKAGPVLELVLVWGRGQGRVAQAWHLRAA